MRRPSGIVSKIYALVRSVLLEITPGTRNKLVKHAFTLLDLIVNIP